MEYHSRNAWNYIGGCMNKKIKLIIEIVIFVLILSVAYFVYYFNNENKEEKIKEAGSVGIVKITDENFEEEILNSDKPVILDFSSNSCPPCVAMLTTLIDIAKNNKDIKVATINIDEEGTEDTVSKYEVSATPTIIIFKDGKDISTLVGAISEDKIMSEVK